MALTKSTFTPLLKEGLMEVAESAREYAEMESMIPTLFNVMDSQSAWEDFFAVGGVPDIQPWPGTIPYLNVAPGFTRKIEHRTYAGGLKIERELIEDKKYAVLDAQADELMRSAYRVREKQAARAFQYAFSATADYQTSEEGVAWCSNSHLTKSGVSTASGFDNLNTTALSKTSVAAARLQMRRFRTDTGERFAVSDNLALVVPDNLAETAFEITNTPKGLDTAEGNVNFHFGKYKVIPYLRLDDVDTNNWFLVDMNRLMKELVFFDRVKPEYKTEGEFETYDMLQAVRMRISYGWRDWRSILGSQVT